MLQPTSRMHADSTATRLGKVAGILVSGFLLGILAVAYWNTGSGAVIAKWSQPSTINYQSFDPYTLVVLESGSYPRVFSSRPTHGIAVVHHDDLSYGHFLEFSFNSQGEPVDLFIRNSKIVWTPEGVTLEIPSGHKLFIPKKAFIDGR